MAKLRISGDSSGYVDLEAPNAASSSTLDLDQIPQKNATTTGFTGNVGVGISTPSTTAGGYDGGNLHVHNSGTGSSIRLTNNTTGTGTSSGMLISKWSDSNTYLTNFDNGANTIFTQSNSSGTLQTTIKLDGDGYVTTPQQPAFEVTLSSIHPTTTGTYTIPFNTSRHNMGSHLNTANGVFTAPVTGFYHFDCQILLHSVSNTDDALHVAFYQNDTHKSYFNLRAPGESANGSVGYGEYLPVIGTVSSYMNANDTMKVQVQAGGGSVGVWLTDWCSFSGFLIG